MGSEVSAFEMGGRVWHLPTVVALVVRSLLFAWTVPRASAACPAATPALHTLGLVPPELQQRHVTGTVWTVFHNVS